MSLRKFISGVTAFAVAASAFAAMAVTASAENYSQTLNIEAGDGVNIFSYSRTTYLATAKTFGTEKYAAIYKDFRSLPNIKNATEVTIEFDTYVYSDTDDPNTKTCFGFGDASQRSMSGIVNPSDGSYRFNGLAMWFGATSGKTYRAYDTKSKDYEFTYNSGATDRTVHVKIIFNKAKKEYTYQIGPAPVKTKSTDIENLTYVDAYTNKSGGQFKISPITVSYTAPPCANLETASWTADPTTGYEALGNVLTDANDNSVYGYKATLSGDGTTYNTVNVSVTTLKGNTDEKTYEVTQFSGDESGVEFFVISNVALDTDKSLVYCE